MSGRLLSKNPVFATASGVALSALLADSRVLELAPATRILSEGEPADTVYALETGAVRVTLQSENGDEVACKLFHAPAMFGEAEAFYGIPFQENVTTVAPSTLVAMPVASLRRFLVGEPTSALRYLDDLAGRMAISIYNQRSLAFNPITIRLANFILDYADWGPRETSDAWAIALTQDDMAAAIGATRRSIGKDITSWQEQGILARRGTGYVVLDPAALERYADPQRLRIAYTLPKG